MPLGEVRPILWAAPQLCQEFPWLGASDGSEMPNSPCPEWSGWSK